MVTVNVSREGRSRERYSYVVSSVPRGVSLAVLPQTLPAPCEGAAARAPAGFDKPSAAKPARALEEQLAFVPHLSGPGKPSARGRAAAGRSHTPHCQSQLLPWVVTCPGWVIVSPAIKRSSFLFPLLLLKCR